MVERLEPIKRKGDSDLEKGTQVTYVKDGGWTVHNRFFPRNFYDFDGGWMVYLGTGIIEGPFKLYSLAKDGLLKLLSVEHHHESSLI